MTAGTGQETSTPENTRSGTSTGRQAAWNYLSFALSKSTTLVMTIVVARLLTPADFGQFALALVIVNIFDYVKDLGVGAAIVQSPRPWERIAPTGLTLSVVFGVATGVLVAAVASPAAAAMQHPELTSLIQVLAVSMTIASLSAIPAARLRRNLDFKRRLWPEFLSAAVKAVLTVALAAGGYGVWSLAYGQLASVVVLTALYWWVARTPADFGFDSPQARTLLAYGVPHSGAAILGFAICNIDYLAIGIRQGTEQLGYYTVAYRVTELLVMSLCIVVSEVLFSALSRVQHDRPLLAQQYLRAVAVVTALTAPISAGLAASAPSVIQTLYGDGYSASAPVLVVLSIYTLVYSASWHTGDVFKALGQPMILVWTDVTQLAVMIGPIWWAAGHGIVMVAVVLVLAELLHLGANVMIIRRAAGLRARTLAKAMLNPMPAAIGMAGVILATGHAMAGRSAPFTLVAGILVGVPTYVLLLRMTAPLSFFTGLDVIRSLCGRSSTA